MRVNKPFFDCSSYGRPSVHLFNIKWWNIVLNFIIIFMFLEKVVQNIVQRLYFLNKISLNTQNYFNNGWLIGTNVLMFLWQLYGNLIYFEKRGKIETNDKDFRKCMYTYNPGHIDSIQVGLYVGYFFDVYYLIIVTYFLVSYLCKLRKSK